MSGAELQHRNIKTKKHAVSASLQGLGRSGGAAGKTTLVAAVAAAGGRLPGPARLLHLRHAAAQSAPSRGLQAPRLREPTWFASWGAAAGVGLPHTRSPTRSQVILHARSSRFGTPHGPLQGAATCRRQETQPASSLAQPGTIATVSRLDDACTAT